MDKKSAGLARQFEHFFPFNAKDPYLSLSERGSYVELRLNIIPQLVQKLAPTEMGIILINRVRHTFFQSMT